MEPTDREVVNFLRRYTGKRVPIGRFEKLQKVLTSPDMFMISVETYQVKDLVRETRYQRRGTKVYVLSRVNSDARWSLSEPTLIWDETFEPYVVRHFGRTETAQETRDRVDWQTICHRPGNDRFPLDSAKAIDTTLSPKMKDHFNK